MQKKLVILFTFAIFMLLVGWAVTPAHAHCIGKAKHDAKHGNCGGGGGGGSGDGGGGTGKMNMQLEITDSDDVRGLDDDGELDNSFVHRESKCVRVTQSGNGDLEFNAADGRTCSRGIELILPMECFPSTRDNCTQLGITLSSDPYFYLSTVGPNYPGNLAPGESFAVNAGFFFSETVVLPDDNWALCFHRGGGGCDGNGDSLIVMRTDNGVPGEPRTYEMRTQEANPNGLSCLGVDGFNYACQGACLTNGGDDQGCYDVQFTITWEEK